MDSFKFIGRMNSAIPLLSRRRQAELRNREETRRFVAFVGLNPHRYERVMEQVDITVLETVAEKRRGS